MFEIPDDDELFSEDNLAGFFDVGDTGQQRHGDISTGATSTVRQPAPTPQPKPLPSQSPGTSVGGLQSNHTRVLTDVNCLAKLGNDMPRTRDLGCSESTPVSAPYSTGPGNCLTPIPSCSLQSDTESSAVPRRRSLRKFPGPAGILPPTKSSELSPFTRKSPGDTEQPLMNDETSSREETVSSSQAGGDGFDGRAWLSLLSDLEPNSDSVLRKFSVRATLHKASRRLLPKGKVPLLLGLLDSVDFQGSDATVILRDPTGEMQGTLHREVWKDFSHHLQPGAALVLRQVSVISPSLRTHYLNITTGNVVCLYPAGGGGGVACEDGSVAPLWGVVQTAELELLAAANEARETALSKRSALEASRRHPHAAPLPPPRRGGLFASVPRGSSSLAHPHTPQPGGSPHSHTSNTQRNSYTPQPSTSSHPYTPQPGVSPHSHTPHAQRQSYTPQPGAFSHPYTPQRGVSPHPYTPQRGVPPHPSTPANRPWSSNALSQMRTPTPGVRTSENGAYSGNVNRADLSRTPVSRNDVLNSQQTAAVHGAVGSGTYRSPQDYRSSGGGGRSVHQEASGTPRGRQDYSLSNSVGSSAATSLTHTASLHQPPQSSNAANKQSNSVEAPSNCVNPSATWSLKRKSSDLAATSGWEGDREQGARCGGEPAGKVTKTDAGSVRLGGPVSQEPANRTQRADVGSVRLGGPVSQEPANRTQRADVGSVRLGGGVTVSEKPANAENRGEVGSVRLGGGVSVSEKPANADNRGEVGSVRLGGGVTVSEKPANADNRGEVGSVRLGGPVSSTAASAHTSLNVDGPAKPAWDEELSDDILSQLSDDF